MNFDQDLSPAVKPEHRPSNYYLYKRARPYMYAPPRTAYSTAAHRYSESDFFSSAIRPSIDRGPQTVEDLLEQGYFAAPAREAETAMLLDRQDTSWLALDDVLTQIRQRHDIYRQNMLELEWAKCYAFNELARTGWPTSDEQHALYQRRLQDLQAEQRLERVRCWSDVSRLRELIPPSAQQYLSSLRKTQILGLDGGDRP
jgi:hypothetical protein